MEPRGKFSPLYDWLRQGGWFTVVAIGEGRQGSSMKCPAGFSLMLRWWSVGQAKEVRSCGVWVMALNRHAARDAYYIDSMYALNVGLCPEHSREAVEEGRRAVVRVALRWPFCSNWGVYSMRLWWILRCNARVSRSLHLTVQGSAKTWVCSEPSEWNIGRRSDAACSIGSEHQHALECRSGSYQVVWYWR